MFKVRFCFIFLCLIQIGYSQEITLSVQSVNENSGLSDLTNSYVKRDSKGLIWISSLAGLNLFDGEKVKPFYALEGDSYAIKNDLITSSFFEDENSNIWFSTNESIQEYRRSEDKFYTYSIPTPDSISDEGSQTDYHAFHLEGNTLWLRQGYGPKGKLYLLDIRKNSFSYKGNLDGNRQAVVKDGQGKIIAVVASMLSQESGFNVYSFQDSIIQKENYSSKSFEALSWLNFYTTNILVGSEKEIWIGAKDGLLHFDLGRKEVVLVNNIEGEKLGLVWGITEFNDQEIAISAKNTKGVIVLNRIDRELSRKIFLRDNITNDLLANPTEIYLDNYQILWTSYWNEGLKYSHINANHFNKYFNQEGNNLPKDGIFQVLERKNGDIIISTKNSGLFQYDESFKSFSKINFSNLDSNSGANRLQLYEDESGQVWGIQNQSAFYLNLDKGTGEKIGDFNERILQFFQLSNGQLVLLSFNGTFYKVDQNQEDGYSIEAWELWDEAPGDIDKIFVDKKGGIYVFHDVNDLSIYSFSENLGQLELLRKINSIGLVTACYEPEQASFLCLASNKGLFKLDQDLLELDTENLSSGVINQRGLKSLHGNKDYGLWMSTQQGVVNYRLDAQRTRLFTKFDGLLNIEPAFLAFLVDRKNRLWIGGDNGLNLLALDKIDTLGISPQIHIQRILVNNQEIELPTNINEISELKLSYRQNSIGFEFASTEFSSPTKNQFRYRLRENDKWIELGNRSELYFDQLPYDNYKLQIQASNADGIWMESPKTIRVRISPPFWQEWWFYLLLLLLIIGVGYWFFDNWARKREMRLESQRLKELDELKTRLYTNITHEFRTPLTVISGMSGQIKGNLVEKKMISRNSRRLLNLVNQMLDLAKIDQGSMQLNLGQSDVVAFLKYVVETYQPFAATKQIYLSIQSAMPFRIMDFDQDKLDQILSNLLSNAIKFTPEKGMVNVHIDEQMVGEEVMLYLSVKDNGKGIPKDKLAHIFDRFYQVDDSDNRVSEGTGIGLSLCKELVELMEGNIQVESDPDSGTLFTILLPIRQEAEWRPFADPEESVLADDIATTPQPDQDAAPEVAPKLLIVEDNPDVATYLSSLLQKTYQVSYASNGKIGLKAAQEEVPDIIISDVMMPEMDGFELCEHLKTEMATSHIPIILLTAKSHMEDKLEGLSKGADAYLTKPFNKEELQIRLEQLIKVRKNLQNKYGRDLINIKLKKEDDQDDEFINALRTTVIERISDPELSPVDLEKAVFLSGSQVNRKLKALTRMTPTEFIRSIRLEKALILLKTTDLAITQVAFEVGFNQPGYFTRRFQEKYECTPSSIRG